MSALLHDLRLYRLLVATQARSQLQYKANITIDIGTYFAVTTLEFMQIFLLFASFTTLAGWSAGEVALLYGVAGIAFGIAEMFGAGIGDFDEMIRRGDFDRVLLRPVSPFLQVAGSDFRLRRFGRLTNGLLAVGVGLFLLGRLPWRPLDLLILPMGILSGTFIFLAVMVLGATLCFWTVETTELTNILTYGGREMLSWPLSVYSQSLQRFFFFVVPLAFGTYAPVCYLLGKPLPLGLPDALALAAPLVALIFAGIAAAIWGFGVRRYQSTGS
jgi:ABC-2 type transport system permease protein